mmetsp:Transcript_8218/g.27301  ORF Transcript_8218/g.27301 Transcript_8218/m.27301 type:complete len:348 (-) Transcript_8218:538-1581(-)
MSVAITLFSCPESVFARRKSRADQTLTVQSYEEDTSTFPTSGSNRTCETRLECAAMVKTHCRLRRSHILTVWSPAPVATWKPLGLKSTERTCLACPTRSWTQRPVRRSHTRELPSSPELAASDPSGWNAMAYTARQCPSWHSSSAPVSTSHSRHERSYEAVPSAEPCGWNATRARRSVCPANVRSSFPCGLHTRAVVSADPVAKHTRSSPSPPSAAPPASAGGSGSGARGWKHAPVTRSSCARTVTWCEQLGCAQSLHCPDQLPVSRREPSGEMEHALTGRESPSSEHSFSSCFAIETVRAHEAFSAAIASSLPRLRFCASSLASARERLKSTNAPRALTSAALASV